MNLSSHQRQWVHVCVLLSVGRFVEGAGGCVGEGGGGAAVDDFMAVEGKAAI